MENQTPDTASPEEKKPTFEESFHMLYAAAPKPIQKFLQEKKYEVVVTSVTRTYKLSIDQMEVLSKGLVFLLLGAQSPKGFSESLVKKANLTEEVSAQITNDINKMVFIPLQTQIQQESTTPSVAPVQKIPPTEQSDHSIETPVPTDTVAPTKTPSPATDTPEEKDASTVHAPAPSPTPLHTPTPSSSPIVKEYSVDPYREPPENS